MALPPQVGGQRLTTADLLSDVLKSKGEFGKAGEVEQLASLATTLQSVSSQLYFP